LDQVGEHQILCNTPGGGTALNRTFEVATCLSVLDNAVPAMGEWGLIILSILFLVLGVTMVKEKKSQISPSI